MNQEQFLQLVRRVFDTEDEEIDCQQVFEVIAAFVEMEIAGENVADLFPLVLHHLRQCAECAEFHASLQDIATLEAQGQLPDLDSLREQVLSSEARRR